LFLIVGLGNPCKKYVLNRHNIGFIFLDYVLNKYSFNSFKKKNKYFYSLNQFLNKDIVFIKPTTYMNLSGIAITSAMAFFKIKTENIIVIYDDISLPFGKIRIRDKGSDGGHNGIKNIIQQLGNNNIKRIRLGIGKPQFPNDMINYVLGDFNNNDINYLNDKIFDIVIEAIDIIINQNIKEAMNKINGIDLPENKT